jgi:glycosyltransferase involved in cell wall biosynthesis
MRIAIVSDAGPPQVNGVVTTLENTRREIEALGHAVRMITPREFPTAPCPTYPDIRLAVKPASCLSRMLGDFGPQAIHITTEGPLGLAARRYCLRAGLPFTTSFHTRFPEYVYLRLRIPTRWTYAAVRWFHAPARCTMVATSSLRRELEQRGFRHLALWSRGVDTELFQPRSEALLTDERPIFTYMGRVAVEKNLEAFLSLDLPGAKYVIGDGPQLASLRSKYPAVRFTGMKKGLELARYLAATDVFVFPSLTDTFGLVMLEAMACGVPVAAYPVQGPLDVVTDGETGVLDRDLGQAAMAALALNRHRCREYALRYSWRATTLQFLEHLCPQISGPASQPAEPIAQAQGGHTAADCLDP